MGLGSRGAAAMAALAGLGLPGGLDDPGVGIDVGHREKAMEDVRRSLVNLAKRTGQLAKPEQLRRRLALAREFDQMTDAELVAACRDAAEQQDVQGDRHLISKTILIGRVERHDTKDVIDEMERATAEAERQQADNARAASARTERRRGVDPANVGLMGGSDNPDDIPL